MAALAPQLIDFNLFKGLETKISEKQVIQGRLLELENAVFKNPGALAKRNGFSALSQASIGGNNLTNGVALSTYQKELLQFDGQEMFSYSENNHKWISKGFNSSVICGLTGVIRNNYQQNTPSVLVTDNLKVYVWEELGHEFPSIRYSVYDKQTNSTIIFNKELAEGTNPKIVQHGTDIVISYMQGSKLLYVRIAVGNLFFPGTPVIIFGDAITYDSLVSNGNLIFILTRSVPDDESLTWTLVFYDAAYSLFNQYDRTGEVTQVDVLSDLDGNIWGLVSEPDGVYGLVTDKDSILLVDTAKMQNLVPELDCFHITAYATQYGIDILSEVAPESALPTQHIIYKNQVLLGEGIVTFEATREFVRSVGIYSKPFVYNNINYFVAVYPSDIQGSYFLINQFGTIVSRNAVGVSGSFRLREPVNVPLTPDSIFLVPLEQKSVQQTNGTNKIFTVLGVAELQLDLNSSNQFLGVEIANNLYTVGGVLNAYDGVSATENCALLFPQDISHTTGTGSIPAGTYLYKVVYEFSDNYGQISYGTPSLPYSVTFTGSHSVTLTIPTLRVTNHADADVSIVVYRTEKDAGVIYYRVTSFTDPLVNNKRVNSVQFTDNTLDADLIGGKQLYTTGGVLPNAAPPANSLIANYKNRVFLSGMEDGNLIWFSKNRVQGAPVEFSEFLTLRCDAGGKKITALAVLDDKLIIFKENHIFYTVITETDVINTPDLIATDIGCAVANSIQETNDGLIFQTKKGIYSLARGQGTPYVGQGVDKFNYLTSTSSQIIPENNQVLFTNEQNILVFDFFVNEWGTWTGESLTNLVDSVVWQNQYTVLQSSGKVLVQGSNYTDENESIRLRLKTDWVKPGDLLQGYMRVWHLYVLGNYISPHHLIVNAAFDYAPFLNQQGDVDAAEMMAQPPRVTPGEVTGLYGLGDYGEGDYGVSTGGNGIGLYGTDYYPGIWIPYQMRFGIENGLCEAIQFEIYDNSQGGAGFEINTLTLEMGTMAGGNRMSDRHKFPLRDY
jgi:hypothetical protein